MGGVIYLIQDSGGLVEMTGQTYDSEDLLQDLLAQFPSLMAGDQINEAAPRRFLLISREVALPSEPEGGGRWSLDHLFLDQDAIPTLVEVKRSSDTRIRREVVGQMLDYAANAVTYLPIDRIRAHFDATCDREGRDPEQALAEFLSGGADQDDFWQKAKTNLQAGRVRMMFVADEIPVELRRVVEFLNTQMDPAEVIAVEIKQFVGGDMKTLVPRVIGQTAGAEQKKSKGGRERRQWDEASFFGELESRRGVNQAQTARRIMEWALEKGLRIAWGKGSQFGSLFPMVDHKGTPHWLIALWTGGEVQLQFGMMASRPPFADAAKRVELLRQLNEIPGVAVPADSIRRQPSIPVATFEDEATLARLLGVLDWAVDQIRSS